MHGPPWPLIHTRAILLAYSPRPDAAEAAAAGEPFLPLADEQRAAMAQLAASLGVRPATALAVLLGEVRPVA